ncbi:DHHC palmitoyltransferase-domain-containing protein [Globomyces pollinis-pini]|nr:DHHC palmitoyltransferase-domain-containing protein [Globomyces pollinis-pini]
MAYIGPYLWKTDSTKAVLIVFCLVSASTLISQIITHVVDPGRIVKNVDPDPVLQSQMNQPIQSPRTTFDSTANYMPKSPVLDSNNMSIRSTENVTSLELNASPTLPSSSLYTELNIDQNVDQTIQKNDANADTVILVEKHNAKLTITEDDKNTNTIQIPETKISMDSSDKIVMRDNNDDIPLESIKEPSMSLNRNLSTATIHNMTENVSNANAVSNSAPVVNAFPPTYPFLHVQNPTPIYHSAENLYSRIVIYKNHQLETKYCITCKAWRAPRTAHCSECDTCIERLDHHCPWMGNCIGKNNYVYFFWFLFFSSINSVMMFIICVIYLSSFPNYTWIFEAVPFGLSIVSGCIMWSLVGMFIYHFYLVTRNVTTREDVKQMYSNPQDNPFNEGSIFKNMKMVLFSGNREATTPL